jgi:hypothetical protein
MALEREEELAIVSALATEHTEQELRLACMIYLSRSALAEVARRKKVDLKSLMDLGDACVSAYLKGNSLSPGPVWAAVRALERAASTVRYMHSLPD